MFSSKSFVVSGLTFRCLLHFEFIGSEGKVSCLQSGRPGFSPWVGKILWRRKWQPTPVLLPGKFHRRRSLIGYSPWDRKESDRTEQLHSLDRDRRGFPSESDNKESACNAGDPSSIPRSGRSLGEGNGKPLQYSCLENPKNREAWWATVHGITKSWTQ